MHPRLKSILISSSVAYVFLLGGIFLVHHICGTDKPYRWALYMAYGLSTGINFLIYYVVLFLFNR